MQEPISCLTRDELRSFLLGKLPEDFSDQISKHLDECNTCEDTVVGLEQTSDSLLASLQQPNPTSERACYEQNADFDLAIASAQQVFQTQNPNAEASADLQRIGDYEILTTIGRGGMGSVFEARHARLDKRVAIKLLPHRKMRSPDAVARFNREMKIVGQMSHPSVVTAFDAGEEDGTHYLVMERVDGVDLGQVVRLCGPIAIDDACELVRKAAIGVQYAHDQGVVHRDVKPSNLMLNEQGDVKVLDLGLATLGDLDGSVDELTTIGQLMGTLDYMAPEQCGTEEPITPQSDVYGLAATLYKLLTGTSPYSTSENDTPLKKLRAMACSEPVPIRNRRSSIPAKLATVIDRGLSTNPDQRFESANEFAKHLEPFAKQSDVIGLLNKTKDLRSKCSASLAPSENPISVPPPANGTTDKSIPVSRKPATKPWFFSFARIASMLALFGGLIWGGIVIYINTNSGQLVIESEVDDVKVSILQNDQPSKELIVEHDAKTTRLFAGDYKVKIEGDSDALVVENGEFQIMRGKVAIVRIRERLPEETGNVIASSIDTHEPQQNFAKQAPEKKLPTYQNANLERWVESALTDPTPEIRKLRRIIEKLGPLTPLANKRVAVKNALDNIENELSTEVHLRVIYALSPLAADEEIAEILFEYCADRFRSGYEFEPMPMQSHYSIRGEALEPAMLFVGKFNHDLLVEKLNQIIASDSPKLHQLAIFVAAKLEEADGLEQADSIELPPLWIPILKENLGRGPVAAQAHNLLFDKFPNNQKVIEIAQAMDEPTGLMRLLIAGCDDASICDQLINQKFESDEEVDWLWQTALEMEFKNNDPRLVDTILSALKTSSWGNELLPDVPESLLEELEKAQNKADFRVQSLKYLTPRHAMLGYLNVPTFMPGSTEIDLRYQIPQSEFATIKRGLKKKVDETLIYQGQLEFSDLSQAIKNQVYLAADLSLRLIRTSFSEPNATCRYVTCRVYRGKTLKQWLEGLDDDNIGEVVHAIAALKSDAENKKALIFRLLPLFRSLDLTGVGSGIMQPSTRAAISIFQPRVTFNVKRGKSFDQIRSPFGGLLIENINDFDTQDANFLLACLSTYRQLVDDKNADLVRRFLSTCASFPSEDVVRRAVFVCLALRNTNIQPVLFEDSARQRISRLYAKNKSAHAAAMRRVFLYAGEIYDFRQKSFDFGELDTKNSGRVATVLSLAQDLKRAPILRDNVSRRDRVTPNFLDSFTVKVLSENPTLLDQPFDPEVYEFWDDQVMEKTEPSTEKTTDSDSLFEYMVEQLDSGKIRLPWRYQWQEGDDEPSRAIENLKARAKTAEGPLKIKLDRVISLYEEKDAQLREKR